MLASAYGSFHEFAAYGPEIVVRRRLVRVGRDTEITVECSKQIFLVMSKRSTRSNWVGVTLRVFFSINHLPIHVKSWRLCWRRLTRVPWAVMHAGPTQGFLLFAVGSVAMPISFEARGGPVVASRDGACKNCVVLPAHIDGSLLRFSSLVIPQDWRTDEKVMENGKYLLLLLSTISEDQFVLGR